MRRPTSPTSPSLDPQWKRRDQALVTRFLCVVWGAYWLQLAARLVIETVVSSPLAEQFPSLASLGQLSPSVERSTLPVDLLRTFLAVLLGGLWLREVLRRPLQERIACPLVCSAIMLLAAIWIQPAPEAAVNPTKSLLMLILAALTWTTSRRGEGLGPKQVQLGAIESLTRP